MKKIIFIALAFFPLSVFAAGSVVPSSFPVGTAGVYFCLDNALDEGDTNYFENNINAIAEFTGSIAPNLPECEWYGTFDFGGSESLPVGTHYITYGDSTFNCDGLTLSQCEAQSGYSGTITFTVTAVSNPVFIQSMPEASTSLSVAGGWAQAIFTALGDGGVLEVLAGITIGGMMIAAFLWAIYGSVDTALLRRSRALRRRSRDLIRRS